jgi:hypothetical protein
VAAESSLVEVYALADATGQEIGASVAAGGAEYALADAASSTIDLVVGARLPADAHEAALVASLGNPEVLSLVIATSRDDGGAAPVVGPSGAAGGRFRPVVILSPLVVGAARDCSGTLDPSARIVSWGATLDPSRVQVIDTACPSWQNEVASAGLLDPGLTADRVDEIGCLPSPLAKWAGGEAACTVEVTMEDDGPCRSHLGMLDPSAGDGVRRPRRIAEGGVLKRVCEVSELLGPQAESCRTTLDCAGCGPGWCTTDLWGTGCSSANRLFLRFVEGALPRGQASVRIVCDLQP